MLNQSVYSLLGGIFHTNRGGKYFYIHGGRKFVRTRGGDKQFYTDISGNNDVCGEKEEDVSEANILASKARKLSAGARILKGL